MEAQLPPALMHHLRDCSTLSAEEIERLMREILHFYNETVEDFIVRRHRELQQAGQSNAAIYAQIGHELPLHRYRTSPLSERQIRRAIYG